MLYCITLSTSALTVLNLTSNSPNDRGFIPGAIFLEMSSFECPIGPEGPCISLVDIIIVLAGRNSDLAEFSDVLADGRNGRKD